MRRILILASNPKRDLALDREIRDLEGVVKRSKNRDEFEVRVGSAVRPDDLQELLLDYEPQIVHFCGHGTGEQGLVLQNSAGREQLVSTSALSSLFKLFTGKVECVLLNACYSEVQADAISQHINYVIGMSQTILDDAAIAFATGFYRALGYGRVTEEAYQFGCNAIELMPSTTTTARSSISSQERKLVPVTAIPRTPTVIPEHLKPVLKKRQTLVQSNSISEPPATPTSENKRAEIEQDVSNALGQEAALKQFRDRVRESLRDNALTAEEKFQLGQLAQQLGIGPAEAIEIFQEEEQLRFPAAKPSQAPVKVEPQPFSAATVPPIQPLLNPTFSRSVSQPPPARRSWLKEAILLGGVLGVLGAGVAIWGYPSFLQQGSTPPTSTQGSLPAPSPSASPPTPRAVSKSK